MTGENGEETLERNFTASGLDPVGADDATWILTSSFVIFTMQTGFGLLESGSVSLKNEVNILMKNVVDVVLGGLSYWMFGYGLQYGSGPGTSWFCGVGSFFLDADPEEMGIIFATFVFQLSFATTATTIVSGAMAERADFTAYCLFSFANTFTYCIPAGWVWGNHGFLKHLGVLDFAGSGVVHLAGGASAFVAAWLLGPRKGRYEEGASFQAGNPTNLIVGTFTLWWGWLVFNCGSTFGITNNKWMYAGRAAINTLNASLGGGAISIFVTYHRNKLFNVSDIVNGILGALVGVTAGSAFFTARDSLIVGAVGAALVNEMPPLLDRIHLDDPVGAVAVHAMGGIWGLAAVGIFIEADTVLELSQGRSGLLRGGGFYLLGVQLLAALCITLWSASSTFILLKGIDLMVPIRLSEEEEELGADFTEHNIRHEGFNYDGHSSQFTSLQELPRSHWDEVLVERYLRKQAWVEQGVISEPAIPERPEFTSFCVLF